MKLAQDNIAGAQRKHKFYYDKRTKSKDISPGDRVLIMQPNKENLLQTQWTGPFVVLEKVNLNNYSSDKTTSKDIPLQYVEQVY